MSRTLYETEGGDEKVYSSSSSSIELSTCSGNNVLLNVSEFILVKRSYDAYRSYYNIPLTSHIQHNSRRMDVDVRIFPTYSALLLPTDFERNMSLSADGC
jgi:hypothetical protein